MNPEHTHEWFVDGVVSRCGVCGVTAQPVSPSEGEAVAWQRLGTYGWVSVDPEDIPHYRGRGQEIRALGVVTHPASDQSDTERLRAALDEALEFITEIGADIHHARIADWYPEGANNSALSMSEDMRLIGNRCATFEPAALAEREADK